MLMFVLGTTVVLTSCSKDDYSEIGGDEEDKIEQKAPKEAKAIDLGLSVKWANMNVGAKTLEGYGNYFAWGETKPKTEYSWLNYKWCNGSHRSQTKYCTSTDYGIVDNKTVLEQEDDAAYVNWGGTWRMPTKKELEELVANCTWTWTTQKGVNGYQVTSMVNGNSIFLPAAGERYGGIVNEEGTIGYYWSSSLAAPGENDSRNLVFYLNYEDCGYFSRYHGQSVRAVCP